MYSDFDAAFGSGSRFRLIDGLGHSIFLRARQSRRGGRLSMLSCAMSVGGNDMYSSVILPASLIVQIQKLAFPPEIKSSIARERLYSRFDLPYDGR